MSETFEANEPMNSGVTPASQTAAQALSDYRSGKASTKPFSPFKGEPKQVSKDAVAVQNAKSSSEGDKTSPKQATDKDLGEVQYKKEDFDPNANAKNSDGKEEKTDSKSEESPKGEESSQEENKDERKSLKGELDKDDKSNPNSHKADEAKKEDEVSTDRTDELLKRLDALEASKAKEAEESKRIELEKQVKQDREATKDGFKVNFDASSLLDQDSLPETVRDYLVDDPDRSEALSHIVSQAMNKLVEDFQNFNSAQDRVGQFDQ